MSAESKPNNSSSEQGNNAGNRWAGMGDVPFQGGGSAQGAQVEYTGDDGISPEELRERLKAQEARGKYDAEVNGEPNNGPGTGVNARGEKYTRGAEGNLFDYFPKQDGESNEDYTARINEVRDARTKVYSEEELAAYRLAKEQAIEAAAAKPIDYTSNYEKIRKDRDELAELRTIGRRSWEDLEEVFPQEKDESFKDWTDRVRAEGMKPSKISSVDELQKRGFFDSDKFRITKEIDETQLALVSYVKDSTEFDRENPRKENESDEEWRKRTGALSFDQWMAREDARNEYRKAQDAISERRGKLKDDVREAFPKKEGTPEETDAQWEIRIKFEMFEHPDKFGPEYLAQFPFSEAEQKSMRLKKLNKDLPRERGESSVDWMARVRKTIAENPDKYGDDYAKQFLDNKPDDGKKTGPEGDSSKKAEDDLDDPEKKKAKREALLYDLNKADKADWLKEQGITARDLDEMSEEELSNLTDAYNASTAETAEKKKEELLTQVAEKNMADWLKTVKNIKMSELDKMSADELQKLIDEYNASLKPAEKKPLVVAAIDIDNDAKARAHSIAEKMLEEKLAAKGHTFVGRLASGAIRNLIWGQMFKEGFTKKYEKQAYEAIKHKQNGESSELDVNDHNWRKSNAGVERFISAYVNGFEDEMIHGAAGEQMSVFGTEKGEDGKEVVYKYSHDKDGKEIKEKVDADSVEAKSTVSMKSAIEEFAKGKMDKNSFESEMRRIQQSLKDDGSKEDLMVDNYLEIAMQAKDRYDQAKSIDNVMDGFRFINGEARRDARTEAHRDAVDRITEKILNSKIGRVVPMEVVAFSAGMIASATQKGATTAAKAAVPILLGGLIATGTVAGAALPIAAGIAVSSAVAGLRERNRVATDRATLTRRLATGETANVADEKLEATTYDMLSATDLTKEVNSAVSSGDKEGLIKALAAMDAAVKISDERKVDLIRFSSGNFDVMEKERSDMDLARAQAKVALRKMGGADSAEALAKAMENATETFNGSISSKDKLAKKFAAKRAIAQSAKTAVAGVIAGVAVQEAVAAVSPDSYGIADEVFHLHNNANAHNTLLAGALGFKGVEYVNAEAQVGAKLNQQQVEELRKQGYTVNQREVSTTSNQEVSVSDYANAHGTAVHRDWASNGTKWSDGNELRAYYTEDHGGIYTGMQGTSTTWNGETINFNDVNAAGKVHMLLSLSKDTQGHPIDITGQYIQEGAQQVFRPDDPQLVNLFKTDNFAYAEIVYEPGTLTNGAQDVISLATVVGNGGNSGQMLTEAVTTTEQVFDVIGFDKAVDRFVDMPALFPFANRKNLSLGKEPSTKEPKSPKTTESGGPTGGTPKSASEPGINSIGSANGEPGVGETESSSGKSKVAGEKVLEPIDHSDEPAHEVGGNIGDMVGGVDAISSSEEPSNPDGWKLRMPENPVEHAKEYIEYWNGLDEESKRGALTGAWNYDHSISRGRMENGQPLDYGREAVKWLADHGYVAVEGYEPGQTYEDEEEDNIYPDYYRPIVGEDGSVMPLSYDNDTPDQYWTRLKKYVGNEGYNILTGTNEPASVDEKIAHYENWWNSLNSTAKNVVKNPLSVDMTGSTFDLWNSLKDKKDTIGGNEGIKILLGAYDGANEETRNANYQKWWDGLSQEAKDSMKTPEMVDLIASLTIEDWIKAHQTSTEKPDLHMAEGGGAEAPEAAAAA